MISPNDRVSTRGGSIPRHAAFIKVAEKFVDKGYTNRSTDFEFTVKNKTFFVYLLKGESIKISGFDNSALEFLPTSGNMTSIADSVPHVQDFCPTCRLQTAADFAAPDTRHVSGRLDATKGRVFSPTLSPCQAWNFDPEFGYPAFTQTKMAREVAIEYDVEASTGQLVFETSALPGIDPQKVPDSKITFKTGKIEVFIGSATIEDIMGVGLHSSDRTDHHFELFYYLLERSNAAKHPLPVADPSCGSNFHRAGGVDCPPVQQ